jgi:CheY-like chemotaxis protein
MSGIEIYKQLEKKDKAAIKRIIFITGDVMSAGTMDFIRSTRTPYIAKPFDATRLVEEIGRIISQKS